MKTKKKIIIGVSTPFALFVLLCLLIAIFAEPSNTKQQGESNGETAEIEREYCQYTLDSMKKNLKKLETLKGNAINGRDYDHYDHTINAQIDAIDEFRKKAKKEGYKIKG